jgi:Ser/Thr protein kinase RdoA (MazF antagonist)
MAVTPHSSTQNLEGLSNIARQFALPEGVTDVQPFGTGNINDTFIVNLEASAATRFILQRINTQVFREPKLVMQNMRISTEHVQNRLCQGAACEGRRWEVPRVLLTQDGADHWIDSNGSFWRAISFIEDSRSLDTVQDHAHAQEVGYALGTFHRLISDLPPDALADTLEGFHITPGYLKQYEEVLLKNEPTLSPEVKYCLSFVHRRRELAHVLETAKAQGKLPIRPIHGDPKVNNVMLDASTGQAVSMIDLDTVKPGLVHYDIGDCLRSGCNPLGEETEQWQTVQFEVDLAQAMLQGYFKEAGHFLTAYDYDYLYDAIRLIAFELGLRFFADHLAHNIYFKVKHPEHNLARALVQFKLTESIETQAAELHNLIQEMR